jgi:hypothetical protein
VGDISIVGSSITGVGGWDAEQEALILGQNKRGSGKKAPSLFLLVKGPFRNEVKLSIIERDPPEALQVSLEPGVPLADGKIIKHELRVEIPKDAPPVKRLGTADGPAGMIIIGSTHPTVSRIPIKVRFTVQ